MGTHPLRKFRKDQNFTVQQFAYPLHLPPQIVVSAEKGQGWAVSRVLARLDEANIDTAGMRQESEAWRQQVLDEMRRGQRESCRAREVGHHDE